MGTTENRDISAENTSFCNFSAVIFTQAVYLREVKAVINVCSLCPHSTYKEKKYYLHLTILLKLRQSSSVSLPDLPFPWYPSSCFRVNILFCEVQVGGCLALCMYPEPQQLQLCPFPCLRCRTPTTITYQPDSFTAHLSHSSQHPCAELCPAFQHTGWKQHAISKTPGFTVTEVLLLILAKVRTWTILKAV